MDLSQRLPTVFRAIAGEMLYCAVTVHFVQNDCIFTYLPSAGLDVPSPLSLSYLSGPVHAQSAVADYEEKSHQ